MVRIGGSPNRHVEGIGVDLKSSEKDTIECTIRLQFLATNNIADYEAILTGLDLAEVAGPHQYSYTMTLKSLSGM